MQRKTGSGYIRKIDFVFYHEAKIREAVLDARNDTERPQGRSSGAPGDPTAALALRNLTPLLSVTIDGEPLEWPEDWLRVIESTYAWCDQDRYIVAKGRYGGEDYRQTCAKLCISTPAYYNLLDDVRHYASLCAAQLGLIKFL